MYWRKFQRKYRLENGHVFAIGAANVMIVGMGTLGSGAYKKMKDLYGNKVVGIDIDSEVVKELQFKGINIIQGDPSDTDFWDRIQQQHSIELVMLALPRFNTTQSVIDQLKSANYSGKIAATVKYPERAKKLKKQGVMAVTNIYFEAGYGFASYVAKKINNEAVTKKKAT